MRGFLIALLLGAALLPAAAAPRPSSPINKPSHITKVTLAVTPRPRPALKSDAPSAPPEPPMDLSHAIPGSALAKLPSSAAQFGDLKAEIAKDKPALAVAQRKSDTLAQQAAGLRQKLIATAAHIEELEREAVTLDSQIGSLEAQDATLTQGFARDRISVTRLLAILERLQHDMPPALAVQPNDVLAAARSAMLVGASLPPVYAKAAALARRINQLKATRLALEARRAQAAATATALTKARADLEILTSQKEEEAAGAASQYGDLKARLDDIAAKAANFQVLLTRIARLRRGGGDGGEPAIVTVTAQHGAALGPLTKGSLMPPVVGTLVPTASSDGPQSAENPGVTFISGPGAQVIAPSDGKVLFAGPYHKSGQVLILEITTGYDLVLAGLGRVSVRPNDELLAGEPVGTMPIDSGSGSGERLYFELRQHGQGLDPTPWLSLELRKAKKT